MNSSQTDDESVSEGGHCCNASLELIEINAKLDKLLKVFGEIETIKDRVTQLEDENKQMKEAADATAVEITNLKTTTVFICSNMEAHSNELKSLKEEVTNLKRRNIRLEAYSRRENVKIFGIKESVGESNDKTEELVRKMMQEKMKIPKEDVESFRFEGVHRTPSRGDGSQHSKPRPIITKFSIYQDKEYMWSFLRNLKGTKIGVANDYPREIDKIHETLYPVLKKGKAS